MATNPTGIRPKFTQEQFTASATWLAATAAKTTLNDTVNAVKLLTAGPYGSLVKSLKASPLATVTATRLLLLRKRPTNGAVGGVVDAGNAAHLSASVVMPNQTLAATTAVTPTAFPFDGDEPLRLGPGEELWVGCCVTGVTIEFDAEYEEF